MYTGMSRAKAFVVAWGILAGLSSSVQALVWDPEVEVDSQAGMYRADVAATTHAVHAIYGPTGAGAVQYRRSTDAGATWAGVHTFASTVHEWNAGIGADGDLVVATWLNYVGGEYQVWAASSPDEGATWTEQTLSALTTAQTWTAHDVTVDGDRVAAFWIDLADGNRNYYCRVSTDRGITWGSQSTVAVVPNVDDGTIDGVFAGDALVAVYYSAGSMLAHRSTDFGQTWDGPITVAADRPTGDQTRPRGLAASGSVVLACWWEGTGTVNVARSADAGLTWGWSGTPVMSTGIGYPSIAMRGAYALVAYQDSAVGLQWSESSDGGLTWGIPGAAGVWSSQSIPSALAFSSEYAHLMANRGAGGIVTASALLPPPEIVVTPESLDFPSVRVSSSAADTFAIANTGPAALAVTDITSDNVVFAVSPTSALPFDVLPQGPETVAVTFTPTVEGVQTANITITHNADGSPTVVTVRGTGMPPLPTVTITAPTADEVLPAGTTSTPLTVAITDHADPGHWHWQLDTSFADTGVAGGNHVDPGVLTDTMTGLVDGGAYTVHVALVSDAAHNLIDVDDNADSRASVPFSIANTLLASSIAIVAPTPGQAFPAGTTFTDVAVDIQNHPSPGHWAWQLDAPFPDSGVAGGTPVASGITDTMPTLTDGNHAVYVALVDGAGDLLTPSVHQSVAFLVGPATAPSGGALLTVTTRRGQAGATVSVPIDTTSVDTLNIGSISLSLTYDAQLLTPVTANTSLGILDPATWTLEQNVIAPGQLNLSMAAAFGNAASGLGTVVTVDFDIGATAPSGASTALRLTRADLNEGNVPSSVVDGTFSVMEFMYGDVSGNGVPTAYDAAWILEYIATALVGPPVLFPIEVTPPVWSDQVLSHDEAVLVADADASGTDVIEGIDAPDASLLLQYDVGLITVFPAANGAAAPAWLPEDITYVLDATTARPRPGAQVTVTLDASAMADLTAGELVLDYDPSLLRPVDVALRPSDARDLTRRPLLTQSEGDGRMAVAFASARPIEASDAFLEVTFEATRDISHMRESAIRASHLRLNRSLVETDFTFPFRIEPFANRLMANYPNPFNPETWIPFELAAEADVTVRVYGLAGELVRTLELGRRDVGEYHGRSRAAHWDGKNRRGEQVASGVYLYELSAGSYRALRRMVVMK